MGITPEFRALIKERREAAEAEELRQRIIEVQDRKAEDRIQRTMQSIDDAAARLDAGFDDPRKWLPSSLVRIGYCVIATSSLPNAEYKAMDFVRRSLTSD